MVDEVGFEEFESKEKSLDELKALIQHYADKPDEYVAVSLAFSVHCYDFGYTNYQWYIANKRTPLTEIQKRILKPFTEPEEDSARFIFDVDKVYALLEEIRKTSPSTPAVLLEEALTIFGKYATDSRFINNCNKNYSAIREDAEKLSK